MKDSLALPDLQKLIIFTMANRFDLYAHISIYNLMYNYS